MAEWQYVLPVWNFNSRPSARGDCRGRCSARADGIFQFTPLREGRPRNALNSSRVEDFNSRPSARGDAGSRQDAPGWTYFNSRPSARGDRDSGHRGLPPFISIHAPPRGATCKNAMKSRGNIFQFTPLREGRPALATASSTRAYFNSRPSARGDCNQAQYCAG